MEAGRLFQGGSSCKQMLQSQSVSGLIVLVLTGLLTAELPGGAMARAGGGAGS